MGDLFDKRFIINTGKGGVGKTTVSAAIGLAAARRGKRVLVMELNAKDKLARLFGAGHVGSEAVEVEDTIYAINVTPDAAMEPGLRRARSGRSVRWGSHRARWSSSRPSLRQKRHRSQHRSPQSRLRPEMYGPRNA